MVKTRGKGKVQNALKSAKTNKPNRPTAPKRAAEPKRKVIKSEVSKKSQPASRRKSGQRAGSIDRIKVEEPAVEVPRAVSKTSRKATPRKKSAAKLPRQKSQDISNSVKNSLQSMVPHGSENFLERILRWLRSE